MKIIAFRQMALLFVVVFFAANMFAQKASFVRVSDNHFLINNNSYYFLGANYWYGGIECNTPKGRQRVIKELDFLVQQGISNLRVLAGVEGAGQINGVKRVTPPLQTSQGVFNESLLEGLDFLLVEMGKRNMKAVIFLSNNWEWSGGFLQYLNWNGLIADSVLCRKLTWDENRDYVSKFYTCRPCTTAYANQVKLIVGRTNSITHQLYKDDAAIMAWELANEPRPMRPNAIESYKKWIYAAAGLVKSIDPNHLVTTGSEGEMGSEDLPTFEAIHTIKNIDYLTIHIWPKNWGWFSDTSISKNLDSVIIKTNNYIKNHNAIANRLHKPLVVEEFGLPRDNHVYNPGSSTSARDTYYRFIFNVFDQSRSRNGSIAGFNFWAFSGNGRASGKTVYWKEGDDWLGDPPAEEQGLNSVFDTDESTWKIISSYKK